MKANRLFAEKVVEVYRPGDIIWVQDYHLLMLPQELRTMLGYEATIAFFLHVPFPHVDVFRLLPHHTAILDSILQVDLAGFHTCDYIANFTCCMARLRGITPVLGRAVVPTVGNSATGSHLFQLGAFPMGIDYGKYHDGAAASGPQRVAAEVRTRLGVEKIVLAVSRLDYTKGVPHSLEAIRGLLRSCPEWRGRLAFVLVVVPSRIRVGKYAELKREIDRLVGEINGEVGTLNWSPVLYVYRALTEDELLGLYAGADVCLVLPLRDGMNLIAKEYVAARSGCNGVLVLSTLAGAARELVEAVQVNPNSMDSVVGGLKTALGMDPAEQIARMRAMGRRVERYDVRAWAESVLHAVEEVASLQQCLAVRALDGAAADAIVFAFARARNRLLVLDYDGTLAPFAEDPAAATPDAALLVTLSELSAMPRTRVVVLSGRDRGSLGAWLGDVRGLRLAAEHGAWTWTQREWVLEESALVSPAWKEAALPLMRSSAALLRCAIVEEKEYSAVFHYRACLGSALSAAAEPGAPPPLGRKRVLDVVLSLRSALQDACAGLPVRVVDAQEALEVKAAGASKGAYFLRLLRRLVDEDGAAPDFVLAVGDDNTDEDVFEVLPEGAHSVRVGLQPSRAQHNVFGPENVRALLARFLEPNKQEAQAQEERRSLQLFLQKEQ
eukprot:TRINITY_DN3141_c0_g1_i3.p1 TRINITY_DN3141_c0_g1~~TRINITY_DN3141_c0_g1_i3.p1  ORF type:complete len:667 (+),score=160.72 TRINITY_DN3141_c0_g1_i3:526-2526(+)